MIGNFAPPLLVYWSSITYLQQKRASLKRMLLTTSDTPCQPKICHFDHIFCSDQTISGSKISVDIVVSLQVGHPPAHLVCTI